MKKTVKIIKWGLLLFLLYQILGGILPSIVHKEVSGSYAETFSEENYISDTEGTERILCIDDNSDALLWRLRAIESAQNTIILSTFDMKDDHSGTDVMSALYAAADRGVSVSILVDGMTGLLHLSRTDAFRELAAHPNVEAKFYNPVNLLKPWKYTFRLHDKYLIIDDRLYIAGGRNTYDLFLGDYSKSANFDRDLLVYETDVANSKSSLQQIHTYFTALWNSEDCKIFPGTSSGDTTAEEITSERNILRSHYNGLAATYPEAFEEPDFYNATFAVNKITYISNPSAAGIREPRLWYTLSRLMENREDVIIQTPYIICSGDMYDGLAKIAQTGKKTAILTNATENGANPFGCADYLNSKTRILQTGVSVHEFVGAHSLHNKSIVIDDRLSIVGSYNLDMRSTYLDTELMLVIDSEELNTYLREEMEDSIKQSRTVSYGMEEIEGEAFTDKEMATSQKALLQFLRIFMYPLRHML